MILSYLAVTEPICWVAKIHIYFNMQILFLKIHQFWSKKYNTQHSHSHAVTNIKKNSAPPIWSELESAELPDKNFLPDSLFFLFCHLLGNLDCLLPDSHKIAAPEHFKLFLCISPFKELHSKVLHL